LDAALTPSFQEPAGTLRVLFQARADLLTVPGGDTIQILKTRESLGKLGVDSAFDPDPEADLSAVDLVHLVNLTQTQDTFVQILNAERQQKKVALSTVYWNREELEGGSASLGDDYREPFRYKARRVRRSVLRRAGLLGRRKAMEYRKKDLFYMMGHFRQVSEIIRRADILLPNSLLERDLILRDFPVDPGKPFAVVVNGIDPGRFDPGVPQEKNTFFREYGLRDYILCVGRIEKRKNQHLLLEALEGFRLPVVCVGGGNDREYAFGLTSRMRSGDLHVTSWPHERIREVYALARLHVLPSYYETPGLASLEAGAAGVNIVVGDRGTEREYFGDHAEYCDPTCKESLRAAVERALDRPAPAEALRRHIRERFTWDRAALQTLDAYRRILRG
jgi:glycosyltransferase involved in cell wall biosynthesis